jgi:hypothetical protein
MQGTVAAVDRIPNHGSEGAKRTVGAWMKDAAKQLATALGENQKNQPALTAELAAEWRKGREDFLSTLMGPLAGQTRELGAPGTPTPQLVTEALTDRAVDHSTDTLTESEPVRKSVLGYDLVPPDRGNERQQEMSRGR